MPLTEKRILRVLMLSQCPFSEREQALGGIMQATFQLIRGFAELNDPRLDLHVLSLNEDCTRPQTRNIGCVTCHHIPKSKSAVGVMVVEPLRVAWHLMRLCLTYRPHVVHAQGNVTYLILSLYFGRKSVQTIHGVFRNEQKVVPRSRLAFAERLKFRLREAFETVYLKRVRNLIAITSQIADLARQHEYGAKKNIFRINNSVDCAFFAGRSEEPKLIANNDVTILFVGLITPRKGLQFLVEAFRRLAPSFPHAKLRIVGIWDAAPDYVAEQKSRAGPLVDDGRVVFTGGVDPEALLEEFRAADIFVLPSLGESAPMVISQALCLGMPIVATLVGGIPEMIESEVTGLLVQPGDVDALHHALERLLMQPAERRKLAEAAEQVGLSRYHPRINARATLEVYQTIAGS